MSEIANRNPSQELVAVVRSEQFVEQIALALPETVSPRKFARVAVTAIQTQPDLAQCDRDSVLQALLKCAADGLVPDGRQAAIVKRGDKASYMPMIGGYRHILADYGWTLRTRAVRANDEFAWTEEPPALAHRIALGDRGDLVCAYAIATHKDGRRLQRVLNAEQIAKRRDKATTDAIWKQWPEQMWEKSAGRDIFDELPLSDIEKQRILAMVEAEQAFERAVADPIGALYGREQDSPQTATPAASASAPLTGDDGNDKVGAVTGAGAASAPTNNDEAEEGVWEAASPTDAEVAAAGSLAVPGGVHKGKTIAQVAELGEDGHMWLLSQLKKLAPDNTARPSVEMFVQGALPDVWARYQRWLETQEQS